MSLHSIVKKTIDQTKQGGQLDGLGRSNDKKKKGPSGDRRGRRPFQCNEQYITYALTAQKLVKLGLYLDRY